MKLALPPSSSLIICLGACECASCGVNNVGAWADTNNAITVGEAFDGSKEWLEMYNMIYFVVLGN